MIVKLRMLDWGVLLLLVALVLLNIVGYKNQIVVPLSIFLALFSAGLILVLSYFFPELGWLAKVLNEKNKIADGTQAKPMLLVGLGVSLFAVFWFWLSISRLH